jgi:hypothetical protein
MQLLVVVALVLASCGAETDEGLDAEPKASPETSTATTSEPPAEPTDTGRNRVPKLDCEGEEMSIMLTDYVPGARGIKDVETDAAQVLRKAGEGNVTLVRSTKQVRVFSLEQDGRVVATVTYRRSEHGGWLHVQSRVCSNTA